MRLAEGQAHDVSRLVSLEQRGPEAPVEFAVEGRADVGEVSNEAALILKIFGVGVELQVGVDAQLLPLLRGK
jgi:hypothetical protein